MKTTTQKTVPAIDLETRVARVCVNLAAIAGGFILALIIFGG